MKKKWLAVFLSLLGILGIFCFWHFKPINKKSSHEEFVNARDIDYFLPIPVQFSQTHLPYLSMEINGQPLCAVLDLGFMGNVRICKSFLESLQEKKFIRSATRYNVQGNPYPINFYQISKIQIGKMHFSDAEIEEESENFHKETRFSKRDQNSVSYLPGAIGWELFGDVNLFLDLDHSKIAFCDSFDTLVKQGYSPDSFIKVPLVIDRGLVEFKIITEKGPLWCMLDSGCTWNILNIPDPGLSIEELILDPKMKTESSFLQIGGKDFGKTPFHCIPIRLPIYVGAVLGMEFLYDHLVFIDFRNEQIYFAPSTSLLSVNSTSNNTKE